MAVRAVSKETVQALINAHPILVFSKTFCPYCIRAKNLLAKVVKGVPVHILELDTMADGAQYQAVLRTMTGQSTVPNIFINKEHIGGCDDLYALHDQGGLVPRIGAIGI